MKLIFVLNVALVWMRTQFENNEKISTYIEGGKADDGSTKEVHTGDR